MRRAWPLLMAAFVSLFLAEAQRALFAPMSHLLHDALAQGFRLDAALWAIAPLTALLAPLLPMARWFDRQAAIAVPALGAAVIRLPMGHPAMEARLIGGALVLAFGAMFLKWSVGHIDRRALGGGVVLGLVADQLIRLAEPGGDPSLEAGWLPVQAFLSLILIAVVVLWARTPSDEKGRNDLERRSGGLRLRSALALGLLLFMDLHVLAVPAAVAARTGASQGVVGMVTGIAGATAIVLVLLAPRPTGGRGATLVLAAVVAVAGLVGSLLDGTVAALGVAAGHLAALLLVTRALDPASGRRSGVPVVVGFVLFALIALLHALALRPDPSIPVMGSAAPWLFGVVGLVLAGCFVLLPRPEPLPAPHSRVPAALTAAGVIVLAIVLSMLGPERSSAAPTDIPGMEPTSLRLSGAPVRSGPTSSGPR